MTHKLIYKILILLTLFTSSCHSKSGERKNQNNNEYISGKVVRILDGDTYDLLIDGNQTIRIRMEGIDAPEKGMPFYKVSKNYLGKLCFGKQVKFKSSGKDIHDRNLGFTYLDDGTELCHEMIIHGDVDNLVPYCQSETLNNALQSAGVQSEFVLAPGGGHMDAKTETTANIAKMVSFFDNVKAGITDVNIPDKNTFSAYANSANKTLVLKGISGLSIERFELLEVSGKIVSQNRISNNQIGISSLENGIYFIKLYASNGTVYTNKFIKM